MTIRCLCCGRPITDAATKDEKEWNWHRKCVRSFFGTDRLPELELTDEVLNLLARRSVDQGLTVPGVQRKMSLHLAEGTQTRLTVVNYPTGYILKPQTPEYCHLPEYEQMTMLMADAVGIQTVPHALLHMNESYAYITRRIDRDLKKKNVRLYAMEDFCQLSGRVTADKYKGSYENCGKVINRYSFYSGFDLSELYLRVLFSFMTGNSDMHLKNFSLIETEPGGRKFRLSSAYDMLPVNVILPEDSEQMALTVNGKKRNLHRNDFLKLANTIGVEKKAALHIMENLLCQKEKMMKICYASNLSEEEREKVCFLMEERCAALKNA